MVSIILAYGVWFVGYLTPNSIYMYIHSLFVNTQLNGFKYCYLIIIQFDINHSLFTVLNGLNYCYICAINSQQDRIGSGACFPGDGVAP